MRISDWSSDVCSSDLTALALGATFLPVFDNQADQAPTSRIEVAPLPPGDAPESTFDDRAALLTHPDFDMLARSEEHTSELQSLMRISYAVFCLKKKNLSLQHDANAYTSATVTDKQQLH